MVAVTLVPTCTEADVAEEEMVNPGVAVVEVRLSINAWPVGVPHPVAKSNPCTAERPLLPVTMSCKPAE